MFTTHYHIVYVITLYQLFTLHIGIILYNVIYINQISFTLNVKQISTVKEKFLKEVLMYIWCQTMDILYFYHEHQQKWYHHSHN